MTETISIQPYRPIPLPDFCRLLPWQKNLFDEDTDIYRALDAGRWWFGLSYETNETVAFSYDPDDDTYYDQGNVQRTAYYDEKRIVTLMKNMQRSIDELISENPRRGWLGGFV